MTNVETTYLGQAQGKFVGFQGDMNVYVYEKNTNSDKKWIYSVILQKDWMRIESINKDVATQQHA